MLCSFNFFTYDTLTEQTLASMPLSNTGIKMTNEHGYNREMWEEDDIVLKALGAGGTICKRVEHRLFQFAKKNYEQFRVYINNRIPNFWERRPGPSKHINQAISELLLVWWNIGHFLIQKVKYVKVDSDHRFYVIVSKHDYLRVQNVQCKLTLSFQVRVASRTVIIDDLGRDVMCGVIA